MTSFRDVEPCWQVNPLVVVFHNNSYDIFQFLLSLKLLTIAA